MKISIFSTILSATLATASPHFGIASLDNWKPAGPGDCMSLQHFSYAWKGLTESSPRSLSHAQHLIQPWLSPARRTQSHS